MISDLDMHLTPVAGQLFNAAQGVAEYGSRPYKVGGTTSYGAALDEPLSCYYMVTDENSDIGALGIDIELVTDTDGVGGTAVSLLKDAALLAADLTVAKGVRCLGTVPAGTALKAYLTAMVTTRAAAAATAGKLKIWLQKGRNVAPANAGRII